MNIDTNNRWQGLVTDYQPQNGELLIGWMGFRKIITRLVMFWKNERLFYEIEATSKYTICYRRLNQVGTKQVSSSRPSLMMRFKACC